MRSVAQRSEDGRQHVQSLIQLCVGSDERHEEPNLSLNHLERAAIREALNRAGGNRRKAAEFLDISERTLYRKIKEFGLS